VRHRLLETVRAFALERLDGRGAGATAAARRALAEWVTTITDLPWGDPCSAAVERGAIRLEREGEAWREATRVAARAGTGAGDLAARLCGPPVAYFLLGRHDMADHVRPLLPLCDAGVPWRRMAVLGALMVSDAAATPPDRLQAWADEVQALDEAVAGGPTGLGGLMRWLAAAWRGDFAASVEICAAASQDRHLQPATRDMFVGIAALDHFSLTDAVDDPHDLLDRAFDVAACSDVAMHRVTCRLGAAWALHEADPDRALELVRRALDDIDDVPALTRLTLRGGASRLLARLDPQVAARGLLDQIDAVAGGGAGAGGRSFVDLIPVLYGTALLHRLDHPAAVAALASVTEPAGAPYLSMMDSVDLARRAVAHASVRSLSELTGTVRAALLDVAGAGDRRG
jgi:hypothetical protein